MKVGCCGFPVGRRRYWPELSCVEVQQTFYHPPREDTLRRWRQEAPPGFEFTLKAWQLITHPPSSPTYRRLRMRIPPEQRHRYGGFQPTPEVLGAWEATRRAAEALGARLVILQCPASFRPTPENIRHMREFFERVERGGLVLGWEPRGWPAEAIVEVCRDLGLVHVVDPFQGPSLWGDLAYWRLHGKGGYSYRYTEEDLAWLREQVPPDRPLYAMFNNASMFEDARRFRDLLTARG